MTGRLQYTDDVSVGSWIRDRLSPDFGSVGALVPQGFDVYVRIFHPISADEAGRGTTWAEACKSSGAICHPLMQWANVRGASAEQPPLGSLGEAGLAEFAKAIDGDPAITVGLWVGLGYLAPPGEWPTAVLTLGWGDGEPDRDVERAVATGVLPAFPVDVRSGPLLELPSREYALFRGSLRILADREWRRISGWAWFWDETINLVWPDDHSWFMASEIDLDSTVVGCDRKVAKRILDCGLEAFVVPVDGDLSFAGDRINP